MPSSLVNLKFRMCTTVLTIFGAAALCSPTAIAQMNSGAPATPPATPNTTANMNSGDNMAGMNTAGDQASQDKMFVHKALEGGMAEVELGKIASMKSTDPDIKAFAEKMVEDHTKMGDDMKAVAQENGVPVPKRLSKKDEAIKVKLQSLNGAAFDKSYIKDMVKDHEEDEAEFKSESETASIPSVKDAATKGESIISMHLDMAKKLAEGHGVKSE